MKFSQKDHLGFMNCYNSNHILASGFMREVQLLWELNSYIYSLKY